MLEHLKSQVRCGVQNLMIKTSRSLFSGCAEVDVRQRGSALARFEVRPIGVAQETSAQRPGYEAPLATSSVDVPGSWAVLSQSTNRSIRIFSFPLPANSAQQIFAAQDRRRYSCWQSKMDKTINRLRTVVYVKNVRRQ